MDCDNFYKQLFNQSLLSDLTISLIDDETEIILLVHKCILYANSIYFKNMFERFDTVDNTDNINNKRIIQVINASIASDVIASFYGIALPIENYDCKSMLELYLIRDFFGLRFVQYKEITVPLEYYDKLVDTIDAVGYTDTTIGLLVRNLHLDYNLSGLSFELLQTLYNELYDGLILVDCPDYVKMYNPITGKYITCTTGSNYNSCYIGNYQIVSLNKKYLKKIDISNGKQLSRDNIKVNPNDKKYSRCVDDVTGQLHYLSKTNKIICIYKYFYLAFIDYDDYKMGIIKSSNDEIDTICISPNEEFVCFTTNKKLQVINISDKTTVYKYVSSDSPISIECNWHPKENILIYSINKTIFIYDVITSEIKSIQNTHDIYDVQFYPNGNQFITLDIKYNIKTWNFPTLELISTTKLKSHVDTVRLLPDDKILLTDGDKFYVYDLLTGKLINKVSEKKMTRFELITAKHTDITRQLKKTIDSKINSVSKN